MVQTVFDKPGRFYKGNIHTHSTVSDGALTPEAVCRLYREFGYDFLSITDHFMERYDYKIADTHAYSTDDFVTIIGAELHTGYTELDELWHILAVGLPLDFARYPEGETGPEVAARAMDEGAFVVAAHPNWYNLTENDVMSLGNIHAIEVYNGVSHDHNDKPDSWYMLDVLTARGRRYSACATDDAHIKPNKGDTCLGWVQVKSESLDAASLVESLKNGDYYSSTGPEIYDVQVKPGELVYVRCSPAERIFVTGKGWTASQAWGNAVREAELDISRFQSPYARVTVRDAKGGRAWTNVFWFD